MNHQHVVRNYYKLHLRSRRRKRRRCFLLSFEPTADKHEEPNLICMMMMMHMSAFILYSIPCAASGRRRRRRNDSLSLSLSSRGKSHRKISPTRYHSKLLAEIPTIAGRTGFLHATGQTRVLLVKKADNGGAFPPVGWSRLWFFPETGKFECNFVFNASK